MEVLKDLIGGSKPQPIEMFYNGDLDVDSVTKRYAGSLVKIMDIDNADHGVFACWGGLATVLENIVGILEEEQGITLNYLPDATTYGMKIRKITPIFPSTVIRAEYVQKALDGTTAATDTGATGSAGSTTLTAATTGTADYIIGGWVYFLTGANAGYLHYVKDDDGSGAVTLATALVNAVAAGDTFLFINPAATRGLDFDATYSGLKSEIDSDAWHLCVQGIMHWIKAPSTDIQPLMRDKHDGRKISNAKFYHDFVFTGVGDVASSGPNIVWTRGIAAA